MPLISIHKATPALQERVFLAPDAWVTGQVFIAADVSIFFGVVMRGDINAIYVGSGTNIQEHALLHTSRGLGDCRVGSDVTIGHHAIIHGCTVGDRCIIGMGSTILDGAVVGDDCIIGANSLITMNTIIPPRSMVFGSPAKVMRSLTDKELDQIKESAISYQQLGAEYHRNFLPICCTKAVEQISGQEVSTPGGTT